MSDKKSGLFKSGWMGREARAHVFEHQKIAFCKHGMEEYLFQIVELAVHIATDGNGTAHRVNIALLQQDFLGFLAQVTNLR